MSCQMGQHYSSSIITLFFKYCCQTLSHIPKRHKMKKATPATDQKRKKLQEKALGKVGAAAKKCLNKDSCSSICYSNKIIMNILCAVGF